MAPEVDHEGGYVKLSGEDSRHQQKPDCSSTSSSSLLTDDNGKALGGNPWLLWPVFAVSLLAGSSSAPVIKLMEGVGPISMAGWRHQVSALVMLPAFIYQAKHMGKTERRKALAPRVLGLLFCSSVALAGHFACYVRKITDRSAYPQSFGRVRTSLPVLVKSMWYIYSRQLLSWTRLRMFPTIRLGMKIPKYPKSQRLIVYELIVVQPDKNLGMNVNLVIKEVGPSVSESADEGSAPVSATLTFSPEIVIATARIWALYQTSIPHCLFLLNTSPVFATLYVKLVGGRLLLLEIIGVSLSLLGIGVLAVGSGTEEDNESTRLGDGVAIVGAVFAAIYFLVGRALRTNASLPLFVYQCSVATSAAVLLGVAGLIFEGWNESDEGLQSGLFGWLHKEYWLPVVFLGVGPGCLGHAGYSYVLRYSSPLVMPTAGSLTGAIGSFLSWLAGQTPIPGAWTSLGAVMTLIGTALVSFASSLPTTKSELEDDGCEVRPAPSLETDKGFDEHLLPPKFSSDDVTSSQTHKSV